MRWYIFYRSKVVRSGQYSMYVSTKNLLEGKCSNALHFLYLFTLFIVVIGQKKLNLADSF